MKQPCCIAYTWVIRFNYLKVLFTVTSLELNFVAIKLYSEISHDNCSFLFKILLNRLNLKCSIKCISLCYKKTTKTYIKYHIQVFCHYERDFPLIESNGFRIKLCEITVSRYPQAWSEEANDPYSREMADWGSAIPSISREISIHDLESVEKLHSSGFGSGKL